jgi:hypothetical protein
VNVLAANAVGVDDFAAHDLDHRRQRHHGAAVLIEERTQLDLADDRAGLAHDQELHDQEELDHSQLRYLAA